MQISNTQWLCSSISWTLIGQSTCLSTWWPSTIHAHILPPAVRNWLLNVHLPLFTCKLCARMLFNTTGLRKEWVTSSKVSQSWKLMHISSQLQSRVGGNELGWECSQCRKQQTTNTTVSPRADAQSAAHQCLTPPIWTHDCQSIQNVSHCSRQGPGLFQRKFGILKMKSTADYSRLKVSKEAWPNAMCKS